MKSPGLPLSLKVKETRSHIHEQAQDFFLCACAALSVCTHARTCRSAGWDRWLLIVFSWAVEGSASTYWLDGGMGEERKRAARKTERVQKRKRDSGRREGNVTRQAGDMEHRISVYRADGGGVRVSGSWRDRCPVCICKCLHPCVCVCVCWGLGRCHRVSDLDAAHSCIIEWSWAWASLALLLQVHVAPHLWFFQVPYRKYYNLGYLQTFYHRFLRQLRWKLGTGSFQTQKVFEWLQRSTFISYLLAVGFS